MYSFLECNKLEVNPIVKKKLEQLYEQYINHRFDLLGSGFVKVDYALEAKGFLGHKYSSPAMKRLKKIAIAVVKGRCAAAYEPINWYIDYKSGFFFNPFKYHSLRTCQSVIESKLGVDIKCPWELGRFYHLVQMAVLAAIEIEKRESIVVEFKNEMIDFMTMNPIGKTVQWSAPMDASIRMVNLLISYDILFQIDDKKHLDNAFNIKFEKYIRGSLRFVMEHLEYTGEINSNHYLSNLAGIVFASVYLPSDEWVDACLVFGVQELIEQVDKQFYKDGGHFEGSTSYHRLSTEFVLYPTALIYGVLKTNKRKVFEKFNPEKVERLKSISRQKYSLKTNDFFPSWYLDRLYNMGIFTKIILKGNNEIVQIGDNDSGRLLKLSPVGEGIEENVIDHRTLISAMYGLFMDNEFEQVGMELPLEASFIRYLSGAVTVKGNKAETQIKEYGSRHFNTNFAYEKETILYSADTKHSLLRGAQVYYFEQFGIVVFRGERLFFSMVIDTTSNIGYMGHTHNDKLSIEVMVDGEYITRDSGGYIYTSAPLVRDRFRSVNAHNTVHIKGYEQNAFAGTFGLKKRAKAELIYCNQTRIIAKVSYVGIEHLREINITDSKITVKDYVNHPFTVSFQNRMYSTGYGKLEKEKRYDCE